MNDQQILAEFKSKLELYTKTAACGRQFVLVEKLREWLRSPCEGMATHAARLLRVAYEDRPNFMPIIYDIFEAGDSCCLLVFCILQLIGCGKAIATFCSYQKVDRLLPMRRDTIQEMFRIANIQDKDLPSRFFELQHRFTPARFELHMRYSWDEDTVLPIYRKNPIKEGGTAHLYQIDIPEEFVGEKLRDVCAGSRFNAALTESPDWRYQFALKSFKHTNKSLYDNEMNAFFGLKEHEGMVRWLADYQKAQDSPGTQADAGTEASERKRLTYNILLEFGESDLRVYFEENLPPVLQSEIEAFWRSLFEIADAVKGIHNLKVRNAEQMEEYYGWHTDIKPDNILYVEDRLKRNSLDLKDPSKLEKDENMFKLADPGFAKFVKKSPKGPGDIPKQYLEGGTETYGAPEYPGRSQSPVTQAIDIWSLGCVFSLAATWIILGHEGVIQYEEVRQLAINKLIRAQHAHESTQSQVLNVSEGDQFHDGGNILEAVTNWHKYLRNVLRRTDTITSEVLDLVDEEMLLGLADRRIKASNLCSKLDAILKRLPQMSESQLPESITTLLGEIDEEASYKVATMRRSRHMAQVSARSSKTVTRDANKSYLVERPLKTTHRQSFWPNQSLRLRGGRYPENQGLPLQTVSERPHTSSQAPQTPQATQSHYRMGSHSTVRTVHSRSRGSRDIRKHPPRNYFQACEELQRREHDRRMEKLKHPFSKEDKKDGLLTAYFGGTREIIFLVDNAESMGENWYEATQLLDVLVKLAKGLDPDGMDLRFTTGDISLHGKDSAAKFRNRMDAARPQTRSKERARTDLRTSLSRILQEYLSKLREKKLRPTTEVNDVVLLILTDGIWAGMENKSGVGEMIKSFSNDLKTLHYDFMVRPFSIEFIQFGNDDTATQRLRYLDEHLSQEGIPDIIDTEHSSGDVNKMLLGSFVEEYDKDEGLELTPLDSPDFEQNMSERAVSPKSSQSDGVPAMDLVNHGIQRSTTGFSFSLAYP